MESVLPPEGVTAGFYKLDGVLLYAPNYVLNKDYTLLKEQSDTYTYPVDGWAWYETEAEARSAFGLPESDAPTGEATP
jgi:hypothetical protein